MAALLLALSLWPSESVADEVADPSVYKGWTVSKIRIEGLEEKLAGQMKGGLALARSTGLLGTTRPKFFPSTLEQDIDRASLFLARRGYPHAEVSPRFEPDPDELVLEIVFEVRPGPGVVVRKVDFEGFPHDLLDEARRAVTVSPGSRFQDDEILGSTNALLDVLYERGYARAQVEHDLTWQGEDSVDLLFLADARVPFYYGDVIVEGAPDDLMPLVGKTVGNLRGTRCSPTIREDTRDNLRLLGLFQQTKFELVDAKDDTLDLLVTLVPRNPRTLEASLRYWSDDGLSGGARWTHRNLFWKGRGFSAVIFGSKFLQKIEGSVWWPALIGKRTRSGVSAKLQRQNEDAYEETSRGVGLFTRYFYSFRTTISLAYDFSLVNVLDKSGGAISTEAIEAGYLSVLSARLTWDGGNDPVMPSAGFITSARVEWAPNGPLSDNHYVLGEVGAATYLGLIGRSVLALRLNLGAARPIGGSTSLLPSRRFYSGGAATHRGFERRKLGPVDINGNPIGGNALLESSLEYRMPLFWRFWLTPFLDAGQVWPTAGEIDPALIEVAVGAGLWLSTPVGPLRFDYARRVTDNVPNQTREQFHFSIGPAF